MVVMELEATPIFFARVGLIDMWHRCCLKVHWRRFLSFHGRRAIARNPMAISKKNNHKKNSKWVPQRETTSLQKARVLSTLQWELAPFSLRGKPRRPLCGPKQWITGAAVPPVPAPKAVGENPLSLNSFWTWLITSTFQVMSNYVSFWPFFVGTRADTSSGLTWKRLSEKDISACLTWHFPWGFWTTVSCEEGRAIWLRKKKNDYATVRGHVRDCSLGAQGILSVEQFDVEFQNS